MFSIPRLAAATTSPGSRSTREGDYNATFNDINYPTPRALTALGRLGHDYGYPVPGSALRRLQRAVHLPPARGGCRILRDRRHPPGYGSDVDGFGPTGGALNPMGDGRITDDPVHRARQRRRPAEADRSRAGAFTSRSETAPRTPRRTLPRSSAAQADPIRGHSHEWGELNFVEPAATADRSLRDSREPVSHRSALTSRLVPPRVPAVTATLDPTALLVPTGRARDQPVDVHLRRNEPAARTTTWRCAPSIVCGVAGPIAVAELDHDQDQLHQALRLLHRHRCLRLGHAAPGGGVALGPRRLRQRKHPIFATAADLYYRSGPAAAELVAAERDRPRRRPVLLLGPPAAGSAGRLAPALGSPAPR